jgi:AraC-like DNA-binding protein
LRIAHNRKVRSNQPGWFHADVAPMTAADFAPVHFSTRDLPERERLPRWREEFGRGIVRVDIKPVWSNRPFQAQAVLQALPGARTVLSGGSASQLGRTRVMAADGGESIGLIVNLGPTATVAQCGRELTLQRGDAFPMLTDEAALLTSTRHLGILLPRPALAARVRDLGGAVMRLLPRETQALRLLVSYLRLVRREAGLAGAELSRHMAGHVHDLAALTLGGDRRPTDEQISAVAAARLAAALADIGERFGEPGLTVLTVARRQGISVRYLQRLLEMSGTSFTARVNELRLQRAFALLGAGQDRRRITDIAMEAGFSDVSHFNRLFRARFGETPSGVRPA